MKNRTKKKKKQLDEHDNDYLSVKIFWIYLMEKYMSKMRKWKRKSKTIFVKALFGQKIVYKFCFESVEKAK